MNREEAEAALDRAGIDSRAYELGGGLPPERFVVNNAGDRWEVYYSEHGVKSQLRVFKTESDALEHSVGFVMADPSAYRNRKI